MDSKNHNILSKTTPIQTNIGRKRLDIEANPAKRRIILGFNRALVVYRVIYFCLKFSILEAYNCIFGPKHGLSGLLMDSLIN